MRKTDRGRRAPAEKECGRPPRCRLAQTAWLASSDSITWRGGSRSRIAEQMEGEIVHCDYPVTQHIAMFDNGILLIVDTAGRMRGMDDIADVGVRVVFERAFF